MGAGPEINRDTMLAYLREEMDDPVTLHWLDQVFAAADDLRAALGITPDPALRLPSERAQQLLASMWARLVRESEDTTCAHLQHRTLQPTVIIPSERRQLCAACWDADVSPVRTSNPWAMSSAEARLVRCDGCEQRRFTSLTGDDPRGWLHPQFRQWWHYCAPLRLCWECYTTLNYSREDLPPGTRRAVRELHAEHERRATEQSGEG